jgi:hypothetical protein
LHIHSIICVVEFVCLFVQSLLVPCVFVVFLANLNHRHRFYLLPKEKNFPPRNPLHAEPPLRTSFFPRAAKSSRRTPSQAGLPREKNLVNSPPRAEPLQPWVVHVSYIWWFPLRVLWQVIKRKK